MMGRKLKFTGGKTLQDEAKLMESGKEGRECKEHTEKKKDEEVDREIRERERDNGLEIEWTSRSNRWKRGEGKMK